MTGNIFLDALFWFLVAVGLLSIFQSLWHWISGAGRKNDDMYVVLTVKNQQDTVEGMIRSIVWQNLHSQNGGSVPQIVVVDLGSHDETPNILKRLAEDFKFIHITDKQGYMDWIKKMVNR